VTNPLGTGVLTGLRVLVPRPEDQAQSALASIAAHGGEPIHVPVIEIVDPADGGRALRAGLRVLRPGDWVVVTSANGAERVAAVVAEAPLADGVSLAVVGPATQDRAVALGLTVDLVPDEAIAEGLVAAFPPRPSGGGRVLLARAEVARPALPIQLRMMGWNVDEAVAYRTQVVNLDRGAQQQARACDAVVFTSASTVTGLVASLGVAGLPPVVISIGPATTAQARELGVAVTAEAAEHTMAGVIDTLVATFTDRIVIHREDAASQTAAWCFEQYYEELHRRLDTGLDRATLQTSDADEITPPNGVMIVVRRNGQPIGCGCLKRTGPDAVDLKRMWVDPKQRGDGVGRLLLARLLHEAVDLGFDQVRLDSNHRLEEAVGLYRSSGFVEVPAFNDEPHADLWFVRDLP